jgi:hypothetical protein
MGMRFCTEERTLKAFCRAIGAMRLRVAQKRVFSTSQKSLEPNRTHAECTANDVSFSKPVRMGRLNVFAASASCPTAMLR